VNGVALGAIAMGRNVGFDVLIDDAFVARRAVSAMSPVCRIGAMGFMTQPTGIDITVNYRCSNRL
jgi:hypothetical protein